MTQWNETSDAREILKAKILSKFGDRFVNFQDVVIASTTFPIVVTCPAHGEYSVIPTDILKYRGNNTPHCPDCHYRKKSVEQLAEEKALKDERRQAYELKCKQIAAREKLLKDRRASAPKPKPTYSTGPRHLTRAMKEYLDSLWVMYPDKYKYQDDLETITLVYPNSGTTTITMQDLKDAMSSENSRSLQGYDFNRESYALDIIEGNLPSTHPDWEPLLRFRYKGKALNQESLAPLLRSLKRGCM